MNEFLQHRKEVIYHELGHWTLAKTLGFRVGNIKLEIYKDQKSNYWHNASSEIFPQPHIQNNEELDEYLVNRICVLQAGVASQLLISSESVDSLFKDSGKDDHSKIQELLFILRGIRFTKEQITVKNELKQKQVITDECWSKVVNILNNNENKIKYIASKIETIVKKTNEKHIIKYNDLLEWLED